MFDVLNKVIVLLTTKVVLVLFCKKEALKLNS